MEKTIYTETKACWSYNSLIIIETNQFKRDLKRAMKRQLPRTRLEHIVTLLASEESLPERHRDHILTGNWQGHRECHILPDWLLIYRVSGDTLELVRTGSHTDLFD